MKRMYVILIGVFMGVVLYAMAQKWTPETLPMVHLQDARRYVCNPDNILHPSTVDSIDTWLLALERDKGVETVVIVVKSIEGDDPYDFGMQLGRKYGIGSKTQNTGLIVMLCTEDRSYQILTGFGLEGTIPDAIARRVQNQVMVPHLKKGDWDSAMLATMKALELIIRGDVSVTKDDVSEIDPTFLISAIIIILIAGLMLYSSIISVSVRVCPRCGKKAFTIASRSELKKGNTYYQRTRWKCKQCGHEEDEEHRIDHPHSNTGSVPPFIFPMGGGRSSGGFGGFGGGSFGGGGFGGGGSGGRF